MKRLTPRRSESRKEIAYYRHAARDRQETSLEIQKDEIRKFAKEHGVEIIKEYLAV